MTALTPVIPSSGFPAARQRAGSAAARRLPLAAPVPVPSAPPDVVYGIARVDSSGRICERAVIAALGWVAGDRLTVTADAGVVTARRDPGGMVTLPGRGYLTIPAALRRRCGLAAGDQVLLAALPDRGSLAAYSLAVVDQATAPTPRSGTRKEDDHDHHPGSVPAGRRGSGAAGPQVNGPFP